MVKRLAVPFLALSLLLALAAPALAAKAPKLPSYSSSLKFAQKFAPSLSSTSSPGTLITAMKSPPAGTRGFQVVMGSYFSGTYGGPSECGAYGPRIEVLVARASPANSAIVTYYTSGGTDSDCDGIYEGGQRLYSRGGFVTEPYMTTWSFVDAGGQEVSDPSTRMALRERFAEDFAGLVSADWFGQKSAIMAYPEQASFGNIVESRVYALSPVPMSRLSGTTFSLPWASGSMTSFGPYNDSVFKVVNTEVQPLCGSKQRVSLSARIAAPTAKKPNKTKPYRYKYPTGRVVCI